MFRILLVLTYSFIYAATISGCKQAESVITCAASEELNCPLDSVQVESLGANQYTVSGCGNSIQVSCKGPADGCLIDGTMELFVTKQCLN